MIAFNETAENGGELQKSHLRCWPDSVAGSRLSATVAAQTDNVCHAGNLANLIFSLCLIFCGVLATPDVFPRFW